MNYTGRLLASSTMILRNGMIRKGLIQNNNKINTSQQIQIRHMGGGGGYLKTSPIHEQAGEVFGVICWLWIFYRARKDLPVVLGWRHPWEHGDDDHH